GHEMLAGMLPASPLTGASVAIDALAAARAAGLDDDESIAARPEVLALTAPALQGRPRLPAAGPAPAGPVPAGPVPGGVGDLGPREALRLRARWLHELTVRAALELGGRLADRGVLDGPGDVGLLTLGELEAAVRDKELPARMGDRRLRLSPPLPAAFRLAGDRPVPVIFDGVGSRPGRGASPGRAAGPAHHGPLPAPPGSVLVVATLDPGLAPYLAGLAGLVAETGSALSHLAILAREFGVPCVVGHAGARDCFPPGTALMLDGTTGEVARIGEGDR
ncbi:MAG TPA: PEP-utilizing enzyme, partial [Acidimicrobiia bacterium]|nr:PEP-utilizing enzyme [Acidimicrobiia bacterium]